MSDDQDTVAPADDLTTEFAKLQQDLTDEQEARLRLMADFENFRKRMDTEKARIGVMANMQLIVQLLDIVDDLQLAMDDEAVKTGPSAEILKIVEGKLITSLNSVGITKVEVTAGTKFDPERMEALTTIPAIEPAQAGTVAQVVSSAFSYTQDGSLVKNAKVIVYK